jgi:hypothetical protein
MAKRRTDNTMAKRRTDNTMAKRRTDNTPSRAHEFIPVFFWLCKIFSFLCYVFYIVVCPFNSCPLAIVLSVLLLLLPFGHCVMCSWGVDSSCATCDTRPFILVTERTRLWLQHTKHINGHLWHRYYVMVNKVMCNFRCHMWHRNCLPLKSTWVHSRFFVVL